MQRITTAAVLATRRTAVAHARAQLRVRMATPFLLRRHYAGAASNKPPPKEEVKPFAREPPQDWAAPVVTYEEVKKRTVDPPPHTFLIDVREPDEVAQGSIPTAFSIPLSGFVDSIRMEPDQFYAKHGFKKPAPEEEIVFYCRSGKRSASACDSAVRNGYQNVKNYSGSWLDWVKKTQENEYNA